MNATLKQANVMAAALALVVLRSAAASAGEMLLGTVELAAGVTNVIDVAAGDTATVDTLSGDGTIAKTGEGTLRILVMDTQKARFDVQGGRVFFDYPAPRVCDDAFFHVDSSRAGALVTEAGDGGTNFVVRWNDVRDNGMYATNCLWEGTWRTNPENRRAFVSAETLNGHPVVDFGPMIFEEYTDAQGATIGHGASMIWSQACTNAYEVYEVISDTEDVAQIPVDRPEFNNTSDSYEGVSFLSYSKGRAGSRRGRLKANSYPLILAQTTSNNGWIQGCVYVDGEPTSTVSGGTVYGKVSAGEGFHVLGFTTREYNETQGWAEYACSLDSFARDYTYSFGGQRLAEYLVFTNRLDAATRANLQAYLVKKWKGAKTAYVVSALNVADGAAVEMAPGVSVKVANVSDGADLTFASGAFELNPLVNPDASFHVDASATDTLALDYVNGTNFVNVWSDVLSNGMYAAASTSAWLPYLPDPENRRPFISSVMQNGRPVVDFGSLLVASHTNAAGYGVGYGAGMKWSKTPGTREVFTVASDTEDVDGLSGKGNIDAKEHGMAYICIPDDSRAFRGLLKSSGYPALTVSHASNNGVNNGYVTFDGGTAMTTASTLRNYTITAGFHLIDFQLTTALEPNWFGHSRAKDGSVYYRSHGGTRIAEYIAFPAQLEADVRAAVQSALRTKWFGVSKAQKTMKNLTVARGATVSVPWNDVAVTGRLTTGGEIAVDDLSAADVSVMACGATVSGALTLTDGATVSVFAPGSVPALSARTLMLAGGGTLALAGGLAGVEPGTYPILCGRERFSGSGGEWSLAPGTFMSGLIARIEMRDDGLYLCVAAKGTIFIMR